MILSCLQRGAHRDARPVGFPGKPWILIAALLAGVEAWSQVPTPKPEPVDASSRPQDPRFQHSQGAIVRGPVSDRRLALLFTGHEFGESGPAILDALASRRIPASFFLTGGFLRNPAFKPLVDRMRADGHFVGAHSDQHLLYCSWEERRTLVTRDEFEADIDANYQELAKSGIGRKGARFFLPAFEHWNRQIADWTGSMGLVLVGCTPGTRSAADYTLESDRNFVSSAAIEDSVFRRETEDPHGLNGFLLLFHLGAGPGRSDKMHSRLPGLLDGLRDRGYAFVRIDQLLGAASPPPETVRTPLAPVQPVVELEETVYSFEPANNGAGPMWCSGSTCIVRQDQSVFAAGLETIPGAPPLNNCRWQIYRRTPDDGWRLWYSDPAGRTREPSPLACFGADLLFLSANPTLNPPDRPGGGPARPTLFVFDAASAQPNPELLLPVWKGQPAFTEHSYRSLAADGARGELVLIQNIGYAHAEWSFRDREGRWAARGQLAWPWGADYPKPQPIRLCYPNVALHNRTLHFCGVSDIVEPYPEWRAYKKVITGQEWDYDFRRLFYTWSPDLSTGQFREWIEIASRDRTCGWVSPGDLWIDAECSAHIVWTERALDPRLRERFFPSARQSHELHYAILRQGRVIQRRTLLAACEGGAREIPHLARFHSTPDGRLFVIFYVSGSDAAGRSVSENRLLELTPGQPASEAVRLPLSRPMNSFFTATVRAGSAPSTTIDLLGVRTDSPRTIGYARIRLAKPQGTSPSR
ncbi:MAG TPA: polysaccharide deacetylase family protein [Candidatus Paceibacterota bacterium]|nr:polysaccharide deacetylase family protein [Verrucomicrobiota bacterium]HRZ43583.1 polysaccharide deacetylase family protein [Candidatus Paceibacterota bacterium]